MMPGVGHQSRIGSDRRTRKLLPHREAGETILELDRERILPRYIVEGELE